jgi:hypothetical protein
MTKAAVAARRAKAAAKAIKRRWRQNYIDENISKPGKLEGVYTRPKLVVRRVKKQVI